MVPTYVDTIIKDYQLFGYHPNTAKDPSYQPPDRVVKYLQSQMEAK
jgi:hypothetical protein